MVLNKTLFRFGNVGRADAGRHIEAMIEALAFAGFAVRIHLDPHEFKAHARETQRHDPATALDPAYVRLGPDNFFWVQILDDAGQVVSVGGGRVVAAPAWRGGLHALFGRQRLFQDLGPALHRPEIQLPDDMPSLSGRIGYIGGCWTSPDWKGRNLIGFVAQLGFAHMYRGFGIDHAIGLVRERHRGLALAPTGYSYRRAWPTRTSYCIGTGHAEALDLVHVSAAELAERYAMPPAYRVGQPMAAGARPVAVGAPSLDMATSGPRAPQEARPSRGSKPAAQPSRAA